MIPEKLAGKLLAECGRCCCLCRRFEPLHIQVHHIVERADGGTDDEDNLIPLCLTCHSDAHTRTKLTRRFTADELKQHRNLVYRLVSAGKLPAGERVADPLATFSASTAIEAVFPSRERGTRLSQTAVDILVDTSRGDGQILVLEAEYGFHLSAGGTILIDRHDPRAEAEYRHAISELRSVQLIESRNVEQGAKLFAVTHTGYLLADQLIAVGTSAH